MKLILLSFLFIIFHSKFTKSQDVSTKCSEDFTYLLNEAQKGSLWALKILDSSAKLPVGYLHGNVYNFGNFDECLSVKEEKFQGKFCTTRLAVVPNNKTVLPPNKSTFLLWSMCFPSSCSANDVVQLVNKLAPTLLPVNIVASVSENSCYVQEESTELPAGTYVFLAVELLLILLIVFATFMDCFWTRKTKNLNLSTQPESSTWWSIVSAWDIRDTVRNLLSTTKESGTLHCLHGIRAVSMLWILFGHRYNDLINGFVTNSDSREVLENPLNMLFLNTYVAVDTFFLLSGLLITYNTMREISRQNKFPIIQFYLYRYLRLTVPYIFVILYYIYVASYIGKGPVWYENVGEATRGCKNYWWTAILYFQNFNEFGHFCITQTWYISIDMQLAFLSPLILLPLYYYPKSGIQLLLFLILTFCFVPFIIVYVNELYWTFNAPDFQSNVDYNTLVYFATYSRASPYLCGIALGYFLYKNKDKNIKIPRIIVILGWILSTAICLAILTTFSISFQPDYVYNKVDSAFYNGFHHAGWALGISWVIIACNYGYGGIVNRILSWKYFLPLSRLTYTAYLTQFIVIMYSVGTIRSSYYFSHYVGFHGFFGDLPLVLIISAYLYLTVEAPFMITLKFIFKGKTKRKELNHG